MLRVPLDHPDAHFDCEKFVHLGAFVHAQKHCGNVAAALLDGRGEAGGVCAPGALAGDFLLGLPRVGVQKQVTTNNKPGI